MAEKNNKKLKQTIFMANLISFSRIEKMTRQKSKKIYRKFRPAATLSNEEYLFFKMDYNKLLLVIW